MLEWGSKTSNISAYHQDSYLKIKKHVVKNKPKALEWHKLQLKCLKDAN